jgi:hypothetical protein
VIAPGRHNDATATKSTPSPTSKWPLAMNGAEPTANVVISKSGGGIGVFVNRIEPEHGDQGGLRHSTLLRPTLRKTVDSGDPPSETSVTPVA